MNLLQTLRVALWALWANRLRSFLTALGVIIGVGAVIAVVAIGEGAKANVEESFAAMGTNLLVVMSGATTAGGLRGGFGSQPTLTWGDLDAIERDVPGVLTAAPVLRTTTSLASDAQNWTTQVYGTTPEYFQLRNWPLASGVAFTSSDLDGQTKVVILGRTVADQLYGPGADPIGQSIRIANVPFEVIGVLSPKGQSSTGQDYDDGAFVAVSTFQSKLQRGLGNFLTGVIFVRASAADQVPRVQSAVVSLLRDRHHLGVAADDDFSIRNLLEIANAQARGTETLSTLLSAIAAVSLAVGGIGIMNIMLVSVTERTREVGLRVALGAKPWHILAQFLIEACTLACAGGVLGVLLGVGTAVRLAQSFGWPVSINPALVLVAVLFSALVGVGFGLYPALKAARLDPIQALRYE
ncbi:MAG TPA: ABC transporter permease [Polyangiaceae bacterium]|nr:ABC transporter permease [Polyangiaceae bacterium]